MQQPDPAEGQQALTDEFADLVDALGAETEGALEEALGGESAMAREIAIARATIDGLRESLGGLQPLGEELAVAERRRLAVEARNQELETERRTGLALLAELGRVLHALADAPGPLRRRTLRRVANAVALDRDAAWAVLTDVRTRLRR